MSVKSTISCGCLGCRSRPSRVHKVTSHHRRTCVHPHTRERCCACSWDKPRRKGQLTNNSGFRTISTNLWDKRNTLRLRSPARKNIDTRSENAQLPWVSLLLSTPEFACKGVKGCQESKCGGICYMDGLGMFDGSIWFYHVLSFHVLFRAILPTPRKLLWSPPPFFAITWRPAWLVYLLWGAWPATPDPERVNDYHKHRLQASLWGGERECPLLHQGNSKNKNMQEIQRTNILYEKEKLLRVFGLLGHP